MPGSAVAGNTPKIIILAGPNGAGKTTFAKEYLPAEASCPTYINADLIAAGLSPFAPELAAVAAGKLMLQQIQQCVQKREGFAVETTLSGRMYARLIPQWQAMGYRVELVFLQLPSAALAIERVAQRVKQGGHSIPADTIERRFHAGKEHFERIYKSLVDHWMLIDTSQTPYTVLDSSG